MPPSVIIGIHGLNNKPAEDVLRGCGRTLFQKDCCGITL